MINLHFSYGHGPHLLSTQFTQYLTIINKHCKQYLTIVLSILSNTLSILLSMFLPILYNIAKYWEYLTMQVKYSLHSCSAATCPFVNGTGSHGGHAVVRATTVQRGGGGCT